ncbi:MAG: hypothetical protein WCD57_12065 [Acidobacteriaceae bacterium]
MLATNWLRRNGYFRNHTHDMRQRLRNERLHDQVSRMAKGTIGLHGLTGSVRVSYLHDPGADDKCAAEKAKRHPERTTGPLVGAPT